MLTTTLRSVKHAAPRECVLRDLVDDIIAGRKVEERAAKPERVPLVVPFTTTRQERINIGTIVREAASLWPSAPEFMVASKLNRQLSSYLFNFTSESLSSSAPEECVCYCEELRAANLPEANFCEGHVLTPNVEILEPFATAHELEVLRLLVQQGAKFRISTAPKQAILGLQRALDAIEDAPLEWKEYIVETFSRKVHRASDDHRFPQVKVKDVCNKVKNLFVVTPADKNPQKPVFWCKKFYKECVMKHLDSPVYQRLSCSMRDVLKEHAELATQFRMKKAQSLPYVYCLPKLHKLEPHRAKLRTLTGKSSTNVPPGEDPEKRPTTSLSGVSRICAEALNSVIDLLIQDEIHKPIKRVWINRDVQEFIDVYSTLPSDVKEIRTADFTTMYTQLPLDELAESLDEALSDAARILARRFGCSVDDAISKIGFRPRLATGGSVATTSWVLHDANALWSLRNILDAAKKIIGHTVVRTAGELYHQRIGVPMGNEMSPPAASLHLYVKEKRFVERLIDKYGEKVVIDKYHGFRYNLRWIDDLISPQYDTEGLPTLSDYGMEFAVTGQGHEVVYVGVRLNVSGTEPIFTCRDKQQAFDFSVIRFPSWHTTVSPSIRVGCVIGMLVRSIRLTTMMKDFFREAKYMFGLFQSRKYVHKEMLLAIAKFTDRHIQPRHRSCIATALRQLIQDWEEPQPIHLSVPEPSSPPPDAGAQQEDAVTAPTPQLADPVAADSTQQDDARHSDANLSGLQCSQSRLSGGKRGREVEIVDDREDADVTSHGSRQLAERELRRRVAVRLEHRPLQRRKSRKTLRGALDEFFEHELGERVQVVEDERSGESHVHVGMVVTRYDGATISLQLDSGEIVTLPSSRRCLNSMSKLQE